MHGDQGPMKKLVQKLLLTGKLNTRLASAVVLHLSQLFICCPAVALFYEDGLLHLMLGDTGKSEMVGEVNMQFVELSVGCCPPLPAPAPPPHPAPTVLAVARMLPVG